LIAVASNFRSGGEFGQQTGMGRINKALQSRRRKF
jgi:hypothetical protein